VITKILARPRKGARSVGGTVIRRIGTPESSPKSRGV
jgi:hypothetical protein